MDAQDQAFSLGGIIGRVLHGTQPAASPAKAPSADLAPAPSRQESVDQPATEAKHPPGPVAAASLPAAAGPAPPPAAAPRVTLGRLVAAWLAADQATTARVVHLGYWADQWVAEQARHAVARPAAIRHIVERLKAEGLRGEALRVNRIIALYWVVHLFGSKPAKTLPVSTLRALLPLIKRQPRTGQWAIRAALSAQSRALWAWILAEKPTAAAVRLKVLELRPARVAPPSRSKPARLLILRRLADLSIDDLAFISQCCQEKLRLVGAQGRAA